jgi:sigma-B regulation protein RsbU (phosphoserine phosphatase)
MRILVVEDDRASALLLKSMLQRWGYDVVHATDGRQAWEILHEQDIRLVISDWMMPRMNGLELCREIRKSDLPGYTYVILLTARGERLSLVEGMGAGADDFVTKPFDQAELQARLRAGVRIVQLEADLEQRNRRLEDAYRSMRQDLEAAARMQRSLLPIPLP